LSDVPAIRWRVRFIGRVQGINFRRFVRSRGEPLGISGFVRNLPDGSVEAELEGDADAVEELLRMAREDHPLASVERIERSELPARGERGPLYVL
jgi:acylphosphatase